MLFRSVPLIAWHPGKIKAGSTNAHISAFWDMMPTFAELTGTKPANNTDGISFLPTLFGKSGQQQHEYLYWEFHEQGGKIAVTKGDWKAIWHDLIRPEKMSVELYHLATDIHEDHNLADRYPEMISEFGKIAKQSHTDSEAFPFLLPEDLLIQQ